VVDLGRLGLGCSLTRIPCHRRCNPMRVRSTFAFQRRLPVCEKFGAASFRCCWSLVGVVHFPRVVLACRICGPSSKADDGQRGHSVYQFMHGRLDVVFLQQKVNRDDVLNRIERRKGRHDEKVGGRTVAFHWIGVLDERQNCHGAVKEDECDNNSKEIQSQCSCPPCTLR